MSVPIGRVAVFDMSTNTIAVLKAESKRLREFADRLDSLANELAKLSLSTLPNEHINTYAGLTVKGAVIKALRHHGPHSTVELVDRLNNGDIHTPQTTQYVSGVLWRMRRKGIVQKTETGKYCLV